MPHYKSADVLATSHFSHRELLLDLKKSDRGERASTAIMLSRIAEFDERKGFLEEGYPSMHAFLVREVQYTEEQASKRIYAARTARRFPQVLVAMYDGRMNLSGVLILASHLTPGNVDDLLAEAVGKTRAEIDLLIANHFPQPDVPARLEAIAPLPPMPMMAAPRGDPYSPGNTHSPMLTVPSPAPESASAYSPGNTHDPGLTAVSQAPGPTGAYSPGNTPHLPWPRVKPLAPQRFGFQCTLDQEAHDLWQRLRDLTSHEVPTGDIAQVLKIAFRLALEQLEKRKYAATARPGHSNGGSSSRHIPAAVKRAVRERDGDRCAFVGESGHRCTARDRLEFDHIEPVARGGASTVENVRLVCRAHNQQAAERAFGIEFMERKRAETRQGRLRSSPSMPERCPA